MPVYEMKFFHSHVGSIGAKNVTSVDVDMVVTGSIFSDGNLVVMIIIGGVGLIIFIAMLVSGRVKRSRAGKSTEGGSL